LTQLLTIARFLLKQFHLAGKDNLEQAKVDVLTDLITQFVLIRLDKNEVKKQAEMHTFFANELPKHLENLQVLAKAYSDSDPFFVGNHLTWCDLFVYDITLFRVVIPG
jgi:hypothetical protein